jgi:hypothetical protein
MWNSIPTASNIAPDVVLGQSDLSHNVSNDDGQNGVNTNFTGRTQNSPMTVFVDSHRLLVTDGGNCRVLIYNSK